MIAEFFSKYKDHKLYVLFIHIIFWLVFFFVPHILFGLPYTSETLIFRFSEILVISSIFYINAFILVPKLLAKRKYILYIAIVISSMYVFSNIAVFVKNKFQYGNIDTIKQERVQTSSIQSSNATHFEIRKRTYRHPKPGFVGGIIFIDFALSGMFGFTRLNNQREKKLKALEREQMTSELSFLKSQINPHFLFNVLNSIYSLSLKKSDDLPDAILRLSDLLRYMTYESEDKYVNIEKEIAYIQNYIELQKLRLPSDSIIQVNIFNHYPQATIAPLILVTFIENAFKHGILSHGRTNIELTLSINSENIDLTVINEYSEVSQKDSSSGIGIQNVKRRLEIMYPHKHSLEIRKEHKHHIVQLKINHA